MYKLISGIDHDSNMNVKLGIDKHADISCVGKNACIIEVIEGDACIVQAFNRLMKPMKNVKIVNIAYAVDKVNHSLDFTSSMEISILCTNQARCTWAIVDDVPNILDVLNTST